MRVPSILFYMSAVCFAFLAEPEAMAYEGRQDFGNGDILISGLDMVVDAKLLQQDPLESNLWKAIPYESEEYSGVMLGGGGGPEQQPISVRLGAQGKYRIFLGLYGGFDAMEFKVKLSHDPFPTTLPIYPNGDPTLYFRTLIISETYWKEADLSGQNLILEGLGDPNHSPGAIAYVRLEKIQERKKLYPLLTTNDGHGIFGRTETNSPQDLLKPFKAMPDGTCMRTLFWGNGCADNCNYPTEVGQFYASAGGQYIWHSDFHKNMGIWKEKGWNSMEIVRDYARQRNWEFQVYIRMEAFKAPFPFDHQNNSKFYNEHPEYRCLDRDGNVVGRLSYAYPEVQDYMLRLIKEISDYDPDGVCLCFIRGIPVVLYEPIMVEGFEKEYGIDPRVLDELDPRWMEYQGAVMTAFVKRVKETLKPNQRLSVIVPANELDCRRWGLDVAAWVEQGIIDDLLPTGQIFDENDIHRDKPENLDFKYFAQLQGREKIRLIPLLYPWSKFADDYAGWEELMRSYLDQGADAYAVWDATETGGGRFTKVKDIGKTMDTYQRPEPPAARQIKLKMLHGMRIDRYHYFEAI